MKTVERMRACPEIPTVEKRNGDERREGDPAIMIERLEGEGRFRSVLGLRLAFVVNRGEVEQSSPEADLNEAVQSLLGVLSSNPDRAVELRYLSAPDQQSGRNARLTVGLLVAREADSPEAARQLAHEEGLALKPWLAVEAARAEWSLISNPADLEFLLRPFPIHDVAEIARREEITLNHKGLAVAVPCPPAPLAGDVRRLCVGLLACRTPIFLSVSLRPTALTSGECRTLGLLDTAQGSYGKAIGFSPRQNGSRRPAGHGGDVYSVGPLLMRIHVASSTPIPGSFMEIICGATTGPVRSHTSLWSGPGGSLSGVGGYAWARPQTLGDRSLALRNLARRGDMWMPSHAPSELQRLRYVVSPMQAVAAFRLPQAHWFHDIPGIRMRPAMPAAGGYAVPSQGVVLGVTHAHGETMPVMIDERHRTLHHFILGATGTGKSTLIQHMMLQDMRRGDGVILVDFHGDLCAELLGRIPRNRVHDVVYFNPADLEYPIGLNAMASERSSEQREEEREGIVNVLLNYFERTCHPDHVGPVFYQTVRNGLLLAMAGDSAERPATLLDFVEVFLKPDEVKRKLPALKSPLARHYWEDMYSHDNFRRSGDGTTMLQYVLSKFSPFVDLAMTRNILCQRKGLLMREVMDSRKILLCNVSKGRLGPSAAMFLGFLLMFKIEQAALSRAAMPEADRAKTCVYIDEVENLDTRNFAGLASEMRKYNVSLTLACQHLSQLDLRMRDALLGNCGTITAFRIGPSDAEALADCFTPLPRRSLLHLPNHHAVVRTMGEDHPQVVGLTTLPLVKPPEPTLAAHVIGYSQNAYGRPRAAVELELCAETLAQNS